MHDHVRRQASRGQVHWLICKRSGQKWLGQCDEDQIRKPATGNEDHLVKTWSQKHVEIGRARCQLRCAQAIWRNLPVTSDGCFPSNQQTMGPLAKGAECFPTARNQ